MTDTQALSEFLKNLSVPEITAVQSEVFSAQFEVTAAASTEMVARHMRYAWFDVCEKMREKMLSLSNPSSFVFSTTGFYIAYEVYDTREAHGALLATVYRIDVLVTENKIERDTDKFSFSIGNALCIHPDWLKSKLSRLTRAKTGVQ